MIDSKFLRWIIWGMMVIWFAYVSATADYTWLTKNTGDTLTAATWNQLIDNVKGITTLSNGNIWLNTSTPTGELELAVDNPGWAWGVIITDSADNWSPRIKARISNPNRHGMLEIFDVLSNIWVSLRSAGPSHFTGWNVGIWTMTPAAALTVHGWDLLVEWDQSYHAKLFFDPGLSSGQLTLSDTDIWINLDSQLPNYRYQIYSRQDTYNSFGIKQTDGSGLQILKYINAYQSLSLMGNGGKVWIGTTNPTQKLEVSWWIKLWNPMYTTCSSANPGLEWTMRFHPTTKVFQWCTGTSWVDLH